MDFTDLDLDDDKDSDYKQSESEDDLELSRHLPTDNNIVLDSEEENSNMSACSGTTTTEQLDTSEEIIRDTNLPHIYIRTMIKSEMFNDKKKKNERTQITRHACKFCGKLIGHVQDHINRYHKNEKEVRDIEFCIDLKLKEKKKDILRIEGDHRHNKKVVEEKKGEMILSRRPPDDNFDHTHYGPCVSCKLWLLKSSLVKHMKTYQVLPML